MLSIHHIFDTIDMIDKRHLDIRTHHGYLPAGLRQ